MTRRPGKSGSDRVFFPVMGLVFILVSLAGFWSSFVVPVGRGSTGIPIAIIFHAVVMFGWLHVFVVQGLLPGLGMLHLHRRVGYLSVGLFLAVWLSSITISISSFTRELPADIRILINNLFFLQMIAWVLSPVLYILAMQARKLRTADHKRYLFLLTFFLIEAAASRIKWLPGMSNDDYWIIYQYLYLDLFLVALVVYDFFSLGRLAQATKVGLIMFAAYQVIVVLVWNSAFWLNIAESLLLLLASGK